MEFNSLLTTQDHDSGAELRITHPVTGEPTDVFVRLVGVDSRAFRALARERNRLRFSDVDADGKHVQEPAQLAEQRDIEMLVASTLGWRGMTSDGKPMEFSKENALTLYENSPDIKAQVDAFIFNRRNFIKG
ncbi:MAG: hypothetical protein WA154_10845 [Moraxellaceae bacterium]